ncbi:MAG: NmrA family NAD(P)-binding protein [Caldilineaceae bacterium]|nr:NmrA family NAD(P)-binding protein [Caldilineaceae bacterium]
MIAVTGAGGKTGVAIIQALAQRRARVRGLVHKQSDQARISAAGAAESIVGNIAERATLDRLLAGVSAVYHICPNMHPDETAIGTALLESAQAAGVQHLVYHSVLHPQTTGMPHHWHKLLVEEQIFRSGLPFTILQPTAYMQNLLGYWQTMRQTGRYTVPYPVTTRLSLVDLKDVAEVAARVLTEAEHTGATYELVGTLPLSQSEVAQCLSEQMGQAITANEMEIEQWEQQARTQDMPEYARRTLRQMFAYYAAYGLIGNPHVLGWLLGRPPTSLESFVRRIVARQDQNS